MDAAAEPAREILDIPISDIDRTHNYRRSFDEAKLAELAESITAQGVIQPVVVRPGANGKPWSLVIGERRVRASLLAKLKTIPAVIRRDLGSDADARAVSIVENLQRENPDPLDEAEGFDELVKMGWPAERIAESVGQKRSYVYARLKLCSLCDEGRKAYRDGKIEVSVAILVARIPSKESQREAIKDFGRWGVRVAYESAARHVHENYMLRLAQAPFDTADEKLLAAAGSCAKCPKRTGNQRELFADVKSADVCTDPPCYKKKADAAWVIRAADAEKKGAKVLDDKTAAKLFPYGDSIAHGAPFVDLAEPCYSDKKNRTYKKLLAKGTPITLARDADGGVHELVPRADLAASIKGSGVKLETFETRTYGSSAGGDAAAKAKAERKRQVVRATIAAIVEKATPSPAMLRTTLETLASGGYSNAIADIVKRRGWAERGMRNGSIFDDKIATMPVADLFPLIVELVISRDAYWSYAVGIADGVKGAAAAAGVDIKAIEKRVGDEAKTGKARTKKAGKVKAKKGGRK